jgi:hypothetical protein
MLKKIGDGSSLSFVSLFAIRSRNSRFLLAILANKNSYLFLDFSKILKNMLEQNNPN